MYNYYNSVHISQGVQDFQV